MSAVGLLSVGTLVVSAYAAGSLTTWALLATRRAKVASEAADLANYGTLLDMRRDALPVARADTDSGLPSRRLSPSDLPPRNSGITKAQEDLFVPASKLVIPIIPGTPDAGKRLPVPVLVSAPEVEPAETTFGRWLESAALRAIKAAPVRMLTAVALTWALLDRKIEPVRMLDAPMAYRPPPAVVATARVVPPARCISAAYLLDRLRAERAGEQVPEVPVPRTVSGRHAINAAPGASAQRDRSTADRQRYEARAARATTDQVRVWDTHEMVAPPTEWFAEGRIATGGASRCGS